MRKTRIAACAAAVGLGAGLVTGVGSAAAQVDPDPTQPPGNSTSPLDPTINTVKGVLTSAVNGLPGGDVLGPTVDKTVTTVQRIATNHSLTTARLV